MDTLDRKEAINYARAAKLLQMEKLRDLAAILNIPKELLLDTMMNFRSTLSDVLHPQAQRWRTPNGARQSRNLS